MRGCTLISVSFFLGAIGRMIKMISHLFYHDTQPYLPLLRGVLLVRFGVCIPGRWVSDAPLIRQRQCYRPCWSPSTRPVSEYAVRRHQLMVSLSKDPRTSALEGGGPIDEKGEGTERRGHSRFSGRGMTETGEIDGGPETYGWRGEMC